MLRSLHIENIAVIRRADLDFSLGFSTLTGETGAGKSMIIDSINLLLGNRVSREIIRTGETVARVSAIFEDLPRTVTDTIAEMGFDCEDGSLMLSRTINSDGRSVTKLNGQSITLSLQREITRMLISIHGQSDSQKLMQKSAHRELVDSYAHPDAAMDAYQTAYRALEKVKKRIAAISQDESEKLRLREILSFQIADIDAVKPKDGEEEILIRERDRLNNLDKINRQVEICYRALRGSDKVSALSLLSRASGALSALCEMQEEAEGLSERLDAAMSEIEDIAETVSGFSDDDREDPTARIDRIEERLESISKLKRKYGGSITEIQAFRQRAADQLEQIECAGEILEALQKEESRLCRETALAAKRLTEERRAAAAEITKQVTEALVFLDMPRVRFEVSLTPAEPGENGADEIEFLIATNAGEPLQPMIKIASGGELSRIMLALRSVLDDRDGAATVIFDEIDTGISGKTSRKVGMKLHETAKNTQVLCVTHSAQIASLADHHYLITKTEKDGRAETAVSLLSDAERVEEIARIMGGIEITNAQRDAAREMLAEYR